METKARGGEHGQGLGWQEGKAGEGGCPGVLLPHVWHVPALHGPNPPAAATLPILQW